MNSPLFSLTIFLSSFFAVAGSTPHLSEIPDASSLPLLNLDFAERKSMKLRLNNGLEMLLISDPQANQSAAAVSVGVGSWSDPPEFPGMAHFCEHMLFMGTKKYPDENEFMTLVSDQGGTTNALTSSDRTVYMFSSIPFLTLRIFLEKCTRSIKNLQRALKTITGAS
jgi:insulysin